MLVHHNKFSENKVVLSKWGKFKESSIAYAYAGSINSKRVLKAAAKVRFKLVMIIDAVLRVSRLHPFRINKPTKKIKGKENMPIGWM